MKAWQWYQPRGLRMIEMDTPVPAPHQALIRVEAVGVCGSDMHYFEDGRIGENRLLGPTVLGHEFSGTVAAAGSEVDPALIGKRVAAEPGIPCHRCEWCRTGLYNVCPHLFFPGGPGCDGALSEFFAVDARHCFPVPDGMRPGTAAMVEPAAVAVHTLELARLAPGDLVAVFGLGPIGLLTAQMARACGAGRVYAADLLAYRVEHAAAFGADAAFTGTPGGLESGGAETLAWLMRQTDGRGVDVAIDCTNTSDGLALACAAARPAGHCILTGISGKESDPVPVSIARRRGLTMTWCRRFRHNYPTTLELIRAGRLQVDPLVTHVFPFDKADQAFELTAKRANGVLKASVEW